jgi:hypothetical protein
MTMSTIQGGCSCGDVRYLLGEAPRLVCICHCNSCRRATGGGMVPWATFSLAALQIEAGALTIRETPGGVRRGHCSRCGTSLTYEHAQRRGEVDITVASLDQPDRFAPTMHIWTQDKPAWLVIADNLPQHSGTAPDA